MILGLEEEARSSGKKAFVICKKEVIFASKTLLQLSLNPSSPGFTSSAIAALLINTSTFPKRSLIVTAAAWMEESFVISILTTPNVVVEQSLWREALASSPEVRERTPRR